MPAWSADQLDMECTAYREAISARIDGEGDALEGVALDEHLAGCGACRSWAAAAVAATRSARVAPAEPVPDLTGPIMASLPSRAPHRAGGRVQQASPAGVARLGLVLVAIAQLCLAVPALLGSDAGAPVHIAHEQGSWALALAVGLLVAAWKPARASAILPILLALAMAFALTMVVDISSGRTQAAAEAPHGLAFLGLAFLWLLAHAGRDPLRPRPQPSAVMP